MSDGKKKICFVVTPIGDGDSSIRRHIDGIIDQAIIPALEKKFDIEVAHRKYEIGSINDRVINSVYSADLVIANLTTLNPNVMFELAIRYSFGKPAIVIAEAGTKLPFDIIDENTIFYINDPAGADALKQQIIEFENNIDYNRQNYGPVYKSLKIAAIYKEIESGQEISNEKQFGYIIDRLDTLEGRINYKMPGRKTRYMGIDINVNKDIPNTINVELEKIFKEWGVMRYKYFGKALKIYFYYRVSDIDCEKLVEDLNELLLKYGLEVCTIHPY